MNLKNKEAYVKRVEVQFLVHKFVDVMDVGASADALSRFQKDSVVVRDYRFLSGATENLIGEKSIRVSALHDC